AFEAMRASGIEPHLLFLGNLRSPAGILNARAKIGSAAKHFDLIHAQFGSACALSSVGHGFPTIVSIRGSDWTPAYSRRPVGRAHAQLATRMTRFALPRANGVVCVSHRLAREVQGFIPDARIHVAPDPVDLQLFRPRDKAESRRRLGLNPSSELVLFTSVDHRNPLKRVGLAHAAVERARLEVPGVRLLIASGRPHQEMPLLASAADGALLTSVAEGWPNCVKEALACDVPFVATDVSDLQQIAQQDGRCHVVDATAESLGDALVETLTDPSPRTGLRRHVADMSFESFGQGLLQFYSEVLQGWGGNGL
ncbi:MAG: glycosyltransferase, partial [Planctomycetales bacterium]|nr:glycosyltransferase [Planctomycetales bacterium]